MTPLAFALGTDTTKVSICDIAYIPNQIGAGG
jgi:hypothetical protein